MTEEEKGELFEKILSEVPTCVRVPDPIAIQWNEKGTGFGEIVFYEKDGKIHCDNEMMSKDFIRYILLKLVDDAVLTEPVED